MKTALSFILAFLFTVHVLGQRDSSCRLKAIQFDLGVMSPRPNPLSQQQFQTIVTDDSYLKKDFSGYNAYNGQWLSYRPPLYLGVRASFGTRNLGRFTAEKSIGLGYNYAVLSSLLFQKSQIVAKDTYTSSTGGSITRYRQSSESYQFMISSHQLYVPLSYIVSTKQSKMFWFSTGLELTPGISMGMDYTRHQSAWHQTFYGPDTLAVGETSYHWPLMVDSMTSTYRRSGLQGLGFSGFAAIPLRAYFHPFLRTRFLKRFHLMMEMTPMAIVQVNRYTGVQFSALIRPACGLRIAL